MENFTEKASPLQMKYYIDFIDSIDSHSTNIICIKNLPRRFGKTHLLMQLSKKYKLPLFVPNYSAERSLYENYNFIDMENLICVGAPKLSIANQEYKFNFALIDEGFSYEEINRFKKVFKNIIGFSIIDYAEEEEQYEKVQNKQNERNRKIEKFTGIINSYIKAETEFEKATGKTFDWIKRHGIHADFKTGRVDGYDSSSGHSYGILPGFSLNESGSLYANFKNSPYFLGILNEIKIDN